MTMNKNNEFYKMMVNEINTIHSDDIRELGLVMLDSVPDYFFSAPASSSGLYHPKSDLGEGGLVRHSICVKRMLEHIMRIEEYSFLHERTRDLLALAALFHDCLKSGTQNDYQLNKHTKFLHPINGAAFVMTECVKHSFPWEDTKFLIDVIASHMGQWNTSSREIGTLPYPESPTQKLLHLADYLASRKDINMDIEKQEDNEIVDNTKKESD